MTKQVRDAPRSDGARSIVERTGHVASDPGNVACLVDYAGYRFHCRNREEFVRICHDVFDDGEYAFKTSRRAPLIIDAGAHVGAATHYFKCRYPDARILSIEANPVTFALLEQNIAQNRLQDVQAIQAALAPQAGEIAFYAYAGDDEPGSWGDSAIRQEWHESAETSAVRVPAVTLSSLLTEPVALLKLDIEGLETAVLEEAASKLALVDRVILEYHGTPRNAGNSIDRLAAVLHAAGLTPEIRQFGKIVSLARIQRDDTYWLMVRAARLNGLSAIGYRLSAFWRSVRRES